MRRSVAVKLTLLPVLAAAATASAQPADPYEQSGTPPSMTVPSSALPPDAPVCQPGEPNTDCAEPVVTGGAMAMFMPPGLAPVRTVPSCDGDPTWPGCRRDYGVFEPRMNVSVIRGGFGHYFGTGGG